MMMVMVMVIMMKLGTDTCRTVQDASWIRRETSGGGEDGIGRKKEKHKNKSQLEHFRYHQTPILICSF